MSESVQKITGRVNACDVLTLSAYGIAVKNGFEGTEKEWLESLEGGKETIYEAKLQKNRRKFNKMPTDASEWKQGTLLNDGSTKDATNRVVTEPIPCDCTAVQLRFRKAGYKICIFGYDKDLKLGRVTDWLQNDIWLNYYADNAYLQFCVARTDDSDITPADIANAGIFVSDYSGENAVDIKVMSYNIGGYMWGTADKRMDASQATEKAAVYKQFFNDQECDLIALTEQYGYMDSGNTISSSGLYDALYPFSYFPRNGWSAFQSKLKLNNVTEREFAVDKAAGKSRYFITADIRYKDKDIHIVCVHLYPNEDRADIRSAEMDELIAYLSTKERFIVFGDWNTDSNAEYDKLTAAGLKLANGGYMGFKPTYNPGSKWSDRTYDNILYSDGIRLKSVCVPDVYDDLASDHFPLVCTLTIV